MTSLNNVGQVSVIVKITGCSVSVMEICEALDEWEDSEIEAIAAVESLLLEEDDNEEESAPAKLGDDEADGSDDEDED